MTMSDSRNPGSASQARDNAGVLVHPPILFLGSILAGVALEFALALPVIPASLERVLGIPILFAGIALLAWGVVEFGRRGTNVPTNLPSLRIVRSGPYRFSRNAGRIDRRTPPAKPSGITGSRPYPTSSRMRLSRVTSSSRTPSLVSLRPTPHLR